MESNAYNKLLADNIKLVNLVVRKLRGNVAVRAHKLDTDDIRQYVMWALWMTHNKQEEDVLEIGRPRFAVGTYLEMFSKYLLSKHHGRKILPQLHISIIKSKTDSFSGFKRVDDADEVNNLVKKLPLIERQYLLEKYSEEFPNLRELGLSNNVTQQYASRMIRRAKKRLGAII